MTFSIQKSQFNITAFAIAAVAFTALHGSMLMGFEQVASNGNQGMRATHQVAKNFTAPRTVTLDRVVVSSRRA